MRQEYFALLREIFRIQTYLSRVARAIQVFEYSNSLYSWILQSSVPWCFSGGIGGKLGYFSLRHYHRVSRFT
jgi:hypothetical protein